MVTILFYLFLSLPSFALTNSLPAEGTEFESVVFFSADQYEAETQEVVSGYCNGNLLSARVMVTAAHCVFMAEALQSRGMEIHLGEYRYAQRPTGEKVRVGYATTSRQKILAQILLTPELKQRLGTQGLQLKVGPSEDVAVIIFDRPLSLKENFVFAALPSQAELAGVFFKGLPAEPTVVTINPLAEISTTDFKRRARLESLSKGPGFLESKSSSRVQAGDSGAPLFVRVGSQWKQAAVTKGRAETFFSNWDVFTLLDQKICAIAKQAPDLETASLLCR